MTSPVVKRLCQVELQCLNAVNHQHRGGGQRNKEKRGWEGGEEREKRVETEEEEEEEGAYIKALPSFSPSHGPQAPSQRIVNISAPS